MKNICPVCKYDGLLNPVYDNRGVGSDEICPCCGFQFGCDDFPNKDESIVKWRKHWISLGCKWFSRKTLPPIDWNAEEQMKR
jgi:hypothetical protein